MNSPSGKVNKEGFGASRDRAFSLWAVAVAMIMFVASVTVVPQDAPTISGRSRSADYVSKDGLTVEKLVELGANRRADLQAARARLAIAEGKLLQAGFRPNPTFETDFGTSKILDGEGEYDFSAGVSQVFELGGKRQKRTALAKLEVQRVRFEVLGIEKRLAAEIRTVYSNAISAARQLDVLESLLVANTEIVRATEARLKEGDVAPLDLNMVLVESDGLKVKAVRTRNELETALLELKTLIGADVAEDVKLAPQSERPPRLELGLGELTEIALRERADLQAAVLSEKIGSARLDLARANSIPNVTGSVRYSRNRGIIDFPARLGGGFINDTGNEVTFGLSFDIPVFSRNQGEIASANGERQEATRNREFLESTIKRDVAIAYRRYRAAAETLTIYSVQIVPRSLDNLKAVQSAYAFGEFSVFDVVNEQRRLVDNVTSSNQSLRDYYIALSELEAALGTTIPPSGLVPISSVLPSPELVPNQISREELLKSIEQAEKPKKAEISKSKRNKEEKE